MKDEESIYFSPPWLVRRRWIWRGVLLVALILVSLLLWRMRESSSPFLVYQVIAASVLVLSIFFAGILWERRVVSRARELALDGQPLCWECRHRLEILPSGADCPECGLENAKEESIEGWKRYETSSTSAKRILKENLALVFSDYREYRARLKE